MLYLGTCRLEEYLLGLDGIFKLFGCHNCTYLLTVHGPTTSFHSPSSLQLILNIFSHNTLHAYILHNFYLSNSLGNSR